MAELEIEIPMSGADPLSVERVELALRAVTLLSEAYEPLALHEIRELRKSKTERTKPPKIQQEIASLAELARDRALGSKSKPKQQLFFK